MATDTSNEHTQEEPGGYGEYAARVRYRLLPGVW